MKIRLCYLKIFNKINHEFMACLFALAQTNYYQNTEVFVSLLTIAKTLVSFTKGIFFSFTQLDISSPGNILKFYVYTE